MHVFIDYIDTWAEILFSLTQIVNFFVPRHTMTCLKPSKIKACHDLTHPSNSVTVVGSVLLFHFLWIFPSKKVSEAPKTLGCHEMTMYFTRILVKT